MAHEVICLREYEYLPYERLGGEALDALERLVAQRELRLFRFYRNRLQAQQFVGVVQTGRTTLLLLPKVYNRDEENLALLLLLLRYTGRLRIRPTGLADLAEARSSFLEVWIAHFARALNHVLQRNPRRAYIDVEERSGFLRGRLLVERMRTGRAPLTGQYPCRYQVSTMDHRLNQVLAFCNRLLLAQTTVASTGTLLRANESLLGDVQFRHVGAEEIDQIHLNRLNRDYEPLLDLCRLLLKNATPDLRSGRIRQLAFVFDMNRLFEDFVTAFLVRNAHRLGFHGTVPLRDVRPQYALGKLFDAFPMRVDLLLEDVAGRRLLVDAKYKATDPEAHHAGLVQADFYQMHAYARAGTRPYDDVVLLYPATGGIRRTYTANGVRLHIREIDLKRCANLERGTVDVAKAIQEFRQVLSIRKAA
ncbi:MAG: hypothetical protein AAFP18_00015 [Bacteroidota bacterium]